MRTNIGKLRKQAGYSQRSFSEELGVSRTSLSKWELGEFTPGDKWIGKICQLLNCERGDLGLDQTGTPEYLVITHMPNGKSEKTMRISLALLDDGATIVQQYDGGRFEVHFEK